MIPTRSLQADEDFMRRALEQARRSYWRTHPNPMVGAVVVRDGEVLSVGHHRAAGQPHAEVVALQPLGMRAAGAEIFVTLEPCNHVARTGPCTQAIIDAGIVRCVVGVVDPDPRVSGNGVAALRTAGIEVVVGVLAEECGELNAPFFKRHGSGLPYVTLKVAMTLDGRIATRTGHSQWVTGPAAREDVHRLRDLHDAILVGTGTLLADDPQLTTRLPEGGRNPLRVVLDRTLRAPGELAVFRTARETPTLLVTSHERVDAAHARFAALGVEVLGVAEADGGLDLRALLHALADREVTTLLCEGGSGLAAAMLHDGLVDRYLAYVAPKIVGGQASLGPVGGLGVPTMGAAIGLRFVELRSVGEDLRIDARVVPLATGAIPAEDAHREPSERSPSTRG